MGCLIAAHAIKSGLTQNLLCSAVQEEAVNEEKAADPVAEDPSEAPVATPEPEPQKVAAQPMHRSSNYLNPKGLSGLWIYKQFQSCCMHVITCISPQHEIVPKE